MEVTIIFTNWRRKENLKRIIDDIKNQNFSKNLLKIVIVDNASYDDDNKFIYNDPLIEIIEKENKLQCWERWVQSFNYDSKYLCIMDDDLTFNHDNVLNDCYNFMENNLNVDGIGSEGVVLINGAKYVDNYHYFANYDKEIDVSIIKGRFMFIRKTSLNGLDLTPDLTCDDIKVSSHLKTKILPSILFNGFQDLYQGNESLSGKHYQQILRDYATKRYFK